MTGSRAFDTVLDVRFPEVDSYGVVWHGHYVAYLEVCRDALCQAAGLTPGRLLKAGYKAPITRFEMSLKRPAQLDDRLRISARLRPPGVAKLVIDYQIRKLPEDRLLAEATTEQVLLNAEGELLLGFPAPVRGLVERILSYQRGELELGGVGAFPDSSLT